MRNCPVCGSEHRKKIYKVELDIPSEYKLANEYNVVECELCGMCYSDTESTFQDFEDYYMNNNIYLYENTNDETIINNKKILIKILNKYADKKSRIINFGIGNGEFERSLFELG